MKLDFFRTDEFEQVSVEVSKSLEILGFLDIADVSSPPMLSRHLVLPMSTKNLKKAEGWLKIIYTSKNETHVTHVCLQCTLMPGRQAEKEPKYKI